VLYKNKYSIDIPTADACAHSNVSKEVIETIWGGINSCMRAVDADSFLSEAQQCILLSIALCERFQGPKYNGICTWSAFEYMLVVKKSRIPQK
jgi:hypothetical protein